MIIDEIKHADSYFALHPGFERAFTFLRRLDLAELDITTHEIDAKDLYALMQVPNGRKRDEAQLEAHRRYIDIQYLIDGEEEIGWKPQDQCNELSHAYETERDIEFYSDTPSFYVRLRPGMFAVLFPGDAHAPVISQGSIHKCVVKVRV